MGVVSNCGHMVVTFLGILLIAEVKPSPTSLTSDLIVQLAYPKGQIQGHILKSAQGEDYYAFQDIPYAKPPVNELRYQIPQRHPGWTGILNTTANKKVCAQAAATTIPSDEDCLYLNVYTPVTPGSKTNLEVYVWIHGGAYAVLEGAITRHSPEILIDYDIIIVTLNYRLGALGFLATDDGVIPGNIGLRDQNLAVRWVHENIHLFGGDPLKVTIGGESAGSSSVGSHILSDMSKGLFRAAVMESGSGINTFNYVPSPSVYAFKLGQLIDSSINAENTTTAQLLEALQKANISDILSNSFVVSSVEPGGLVLDDLFWAPTLETEYKVEPFISRPMHEALIKGDFQRVPILIGINSEEALWFLPTSDADVSFKVRTWEEFYERVAYLEADPRRIVNSELNVAESNRALVGNLIKKIYTNSSFMDDPYAYVRISSDSYFAHATIRQADTSSQYVPVYLYQFDYAANSTSQFPGAEHTEELQYFWKSDEDVGDINEFQPVLRHRLCKLWTNFVKHLNPTPHLDEDFGNLIWPKVHPNNIRYVNINETLKVYTNPRNYYEVRDIMNEYQEEPFIAYF